MHLEENSGFFPVDFSGGRPLCDTLSQKKLFFLRKERREFPEKE